jgi:hypothetical protein
MDTYEAIENALIERLSGYEVRKLANGAEPVMVPVPVFLEEPHSAVLDTVAYPSFVIVLDMDEPDIERLHSNEFYVAGVASEDDRGPTSFYTEDEPEPYNFEYRIHAFATDGMMIRDLAMIVERTLPFRGALQIAEGMMVDCFRSDRLNASGGEDSPRYHYLWRFSVKARMHYPNTREEVLVRRQTVLEVGSMRFRSSATGSVPVDSAGNPVDGGPAALDTLDVFVVEHDLPPE